MNREEVNKDFIYLNNSKHKISDAKNHANYLQIDVLKAIAIIFVISMHSLPMAITLAIYYDFHFLLGLPLFCLLLGCNMSFSFKKRNYNSMKSMYSKEYFSKRVNRVILPYIFIFIISALLRLVIFNSTIGTLIVEEMSKLDFKYRLIDDILLYFIGYLPLSGPGNGFMLILFEFIFIFPLLYRVYQYNPKLLLITCFMIEVAFLLFFTEVFPEESEFINEYFNIIRFLFLIALGIWISDENKINSKKNRFVLIGLPFSVIYLIIKILYKLPYYYHHMTFLRSFYIVFIVLIFFKIIPASSKIKFYSIIRKIGKESYHLFLVQILYFGVGYSFGNIFILHGWDFEGNIFLFYFIALLLDIIACLILGHLFYIFEQNLTNRIIKYRKEQRDLLPLYIALLVFLIIFSMIFFLLILFL